MALGDTAAVLTGSSHLSRYDATPFLYAAEFNQNGQIQVTVDSRLSARGLTALRLNRGNVFLKKKFYFP
jgi:hypothetical protein